MPEITTPFYYQLRIHVLQTKNGHSKTIVRWMGGYQLLSALRLQRRQSLLANNGSKITALAVWNGL